MTKAGTNGSRVFQVGTKSMVDADAAQDPTQLAENPAYRRVVPITSDAGRILAALLGGAVATEAQVSAAAAAGAKWPQLGLTVNARHAEGLAENALCGTRPEGAGRVARNALRVFDGGIRALGAVNVFSEGGLAAEVVRQINAEPANPFVITM